MNKATGERNCLVCGKRVGKNLVLCELCPRAYHTDCHNPVMPKVSIYRIHIFFNPCLFKDNSIVLTIKSIYKYKCTYIVVHTMFCLQMPRGKWYCSNCHSKQPKKRNSSRRSHTKGGGTRESESSDHPPAR